MPTADRRESLGTAYRSLPRNGHGDAHDPETHPGWLSADAKRPPKQFEDGKLQSSEQCGPDPSRVTEGVKQHEVV